MDWPVVCPSFRLSLSFILPPFTPLTLGVPGSSISNGAAAAAGSLASLIAAFNDLDPDYLAVVRTTLDSQDLALSLLEMQCQQALDAMDVDSPSVHLPAANTSEEIEIDGQPFKIFYPSEPQPSDTLVLPGRYEKDTGVFHASYRDLNSLKRTALVELCKQYGLGAQGNMRVLKEKLIGFSENKIRWQCLLPIARRAHRGVRNGGITKNNPVPKKGAAAAPSTSKSKKLKLSTLRRNEMMGLPLDAPLGVQLFDTERSKDMRTLEQKNRLLSWAKTFCDKHPYVTREELAQRRKIKEEERARENATSTSFSGFIMTTYTYLFSPLVPTVNNSPASITAGHVLPLKVWTTNTGLQMPASSAAIGASPGDSVTPTHVNNNGSFSNAQNSGKSNADTQSAANIPKSSDSSTKPSDNSTKPPDNSTEPPDNSTTSTDEYERVYVLTVGLGRIVHYKECDLREPPSITFASNIPRLDRVWDDERPSWDPEDCGKNLLSINGTPIALRYWRDVFSGKKSSVWASLKKLWSEWKYVAERYRASSPDEFWKEFSFSDGRRFHWKAISDQLRDLRSKHEQQLVDKAKADPPIHKFDAKAIVAQPITTGIHRV
ncbi:protein [Lentinula edodes]|uniref:Protein n=1 Tax=Lentinula edodes TaxID=5353 RepID=A0A1Q3EK73_LENED|nr:protein [Lentinula edodes]